MFKLVLSKKHLFSFAVIMICLGCFNTDLFAQKKDHTKIQALYDQIKAAGIRHPEFVIAQCIQETGWLSCKNCCLKYHNLFGFYIKGNKCKKFSSDQECINYYKTWQDKRYDSWRQKNPNQDYYHFLKTVGYATGDKYNRELRPHVEWVKENLDL